MLLACPLNLHPHHKILAEELNPKELVTPDDLGISTMWETSALVELLARKGVLTTQEVLDVIQELRRREHTGIPPRRFET